MESSPLAYSSSVAASFSSYSASFSGSCGLPRFLLFFSSRLGGLLLSRHAIFTT